MAEKKSSIVELVEDRELMDLFEKAAKKNDLTAEEVLSGFIKDYIVSGGHPEQVTGSFPWNKTEQ